MEITSDNRLIRPSGRSQNELRNIEFIPSFTKHAEGSCLVKYGDTHVICTASIEEKVPIIILAIFGTLISTFVVGTMVFYLFPLHPKSLR